MYVVFSHKCIIYINDNVIINSYSSKCRWLVVDMLQVKFDFKLILIFLCLIFIIIY